MEEIILIKGVPLEKIWGGTTIRNKLNLQSKIKQIGEYWFVSGIATHESDVFKCNQVIADKLTNHYQSNPEFYGNYPSKEFPVLIKIIDANEDLSLQVHPSESYALEKFNQHGKYEFWVVLDSIPLGEIAIGHDLMNKDELESALIMGDIIKHVRRIPIKRGDHFTIPAGTLHAILSGTLIYEIQQSSDLTFRVYDYNRKDQQGNLRELHITDAISVINTPCEFKVNNSISLKHTTYQEIFLEKNSFFNVLRIENHGSTNYSIDGYFNIFGCIEGSGSINGIPIEFGSHLIVSNNLKSIKIEGEVSLIRTQPV